MTAKVKESIILTFPPKNKNLYDCQEISAIKYGAGPMRGTTSNLSKFVIVYIFLN